MLPITIKKKDSHTTRMANQVLSHSLFPDHQSNKPSTTRQVWKLYSKAKDNLQNGSRLENLSWRMMAMTLKKKTASQESTPEKANITTPETVVIDNHYYGSNYNCSNDPPSDIALSIDEMLNFYCDTSTTTTASTTTSSTTTNESSQTQCNNCSTKITPLWRRDPSGNSLCNACGLFLKLHGVVRPLSLKKDVIKKRNRNNSRSSKKPIEINKRQRQQEQQEIYMDYQPSTALSSSFDSSFTSVTNTSYPLLPDLDFNNIPPELLPFLTCVPNNSFFT